MSCRSAQYLGYTLAEVLIVLMITIILGSLGMASFGGLRDTVLVKQNIEGIKQDIRLVQQKSMLLERKKGEGWIYGIGIDFRDISKGSYKFFKVCSPFSEYGDIRTRSDIIAYNNEIDIGSLDSEGIYSNGQNAMLPVLSDDFESGGFCDSSNTKKYMTNLQGMEDGQLNAGYDITLNTEASFVVFEAVTGRAFLYDSSGWPINYDKDGNLVENDETHQLTNLEIRIFRNRGAIADEISIAPLSGSVKHVIINNPDALSYVNTDNRRIYSKIYSYYPYISN